MKKTVLFLFISLLTRLAFSQDATTALLFSQTFYNGTARSVAMGGAFSVFGSDMSAIAYNPAGLGIFRHSMISFSPSLQSRKTTADFLNSQNDDSRFSFSLENIGLVASYPTTAEDSNWKGFNFSVTYNRLNNFAQNVYMEGVNTNSSMTDFFAIQAEGIHYQDLTDYNSASLFAELAWNSFLIDTLSGNPTSYQSVLATLGETQRKSIMQKGSMGEYNFAFAANYQNKLYFGASFAKQGAKYDLITRFSEEDEAATISDFKSFNLDEKLNILVSGMSFKMGFIFKPIQWFNIGAAFHSPTFYSVEENYSYSMQSTFDDGSSSEKSTISATNKYELTTPYKLIGSLGFIVNKSALVSFEYEYLNYADMRLQATDYDFHDENIDIQKLTTATHNFRIGTEYRLANFSFRGGLAYYANPYSSESILSSDRQDFSLGFGIREKSVVIDLAYVHSRFNETQNLYTAFVDQDPVMAGLKSVKNKIILSLSFYF